MVVTLAGEYSVLIKMDPQEEWGHIMCVKISRMWLELMKADFRRK